MADRRPGSRPRPRSAAGPAAAGLALSLALTACGGSSTGPAQIVGADPREDDGRWGSVLTQPYTVPSTALVATDGSSYSLAEDTEAPLTLVFFGYTNCPDICQVVMASLASAMTRLAPEQRDQVEVVFVTTDPARDDAAVVQDYVERFDPSFTGLTGDLPTIVEVGNALGVAVEKGERLPSGGYEVTHGTQVVGITADDRAPIVWTEGTSAAQYAADVAALLEEDA